jgi:hypothetical protein
LYDDGTIRQKVAPPELISLPVNGYVPPVPCEEPPSGGTTLPVAVEVPVPVPVGLPVEPVKLPPPQVVLRNVKRTEASITITASGRIRLIDFSFAAIKE